MRIAATHRGMGVWRLGAVVALLLLAAAPRAGAMPADPDVPESGPAYLVRNINESRDRSYGSDPYGYVAAGGWLYFFADDGERGRELWRSDLTAAGTLPWRELGFAPSLASAAHTLAFGDVLIAVADDGLWRSDGTPAGTAQLLPGGGWWTRLAGSVLYLARDGALWALSEPRGTPQRLASLRPGFEALREVVGDTGRVYFLACDDHDNYRTCDWWTSDGTMSGTRLLAAPPSHEDTRGYHDLHLLAAENGAFAVSCASDDGGFWEPICELWHTDGTSALTAMVARLPRSPSSPHALRSPIALGAGLFFTGCTAAAGCEPWYSDGTPAGTGMLVDASPGSDSSLPETELAEERIAHRGVVYFVARTPDAGAEVWRSDGSPAGTRLLRDITPGPGYGLIRDYDYYDVVRPYFAPLGDAMTFAAGDGVHGFELWRSDGTELGTQIVADLVPGAGGVFDGIARQACTNQDPPRVVAGSTLWFAACVDEDDEPRWELWRSDGNTAAGPIENDILPRLLVAGEGLYFARRDRERYAARLAWRRDGAAQALPLAISRGTEEFNYALPIGGGLALTCWPSREPCWTDGTAEGTRVLRDIGSADADADPVGLTPLGGAVVFSADDGVHGRELWRSDATAAGTALVADIRPGAAGAELLQLTALDGAVVFTADDGTHGIELWRSDGTAAGTWLVADVFPGPTGSQPHRFHVSGDTLYFWADDGVHGRELWRSDGTPAGTALVADLRPGPPGSDTEYGPNHSWPYRGGGATWRGLFYFAADGGVSGEDLWQSDGTAGGTRLVADLPSAGEFGGRIDDVQAAGDRLVFDRNPQSWESDGTAAGTRLLTPPVWIDRLTTIGDRVYAHAEDALWRLDPPSGWTPLDPALTFPWLFDFHGLLFAFDDDTGLWREDFGALGPRDISHWEWSLLFTDRSLLLYDDDTRALWTSDGMPDGTVPLQRLPELARRRHSYYASTHSFTHAGDTVFFAANTGDIGRELWALPADALPAVCIDDCPWHWTPTPTETPEPATPTPTVVPATPTPTPACGDDCTVVTLDAANGPAGSRVTLSARLSARREAIAGVDLTLALDRDLSVAATARGLPDCRVDPAIDKPASAFRFAPYGCTPARDCTGVRALIIAVDNVDPIADGATLFTCTLDIAARARPGRRTLSIARLDASDANGWPTAAQAANGEMTVLARAAQTTSGGGADSGGCQTTAGEPSTPSPLAWPLIPALVFLAVARRRSRRPYPLDFALDA